MTSGSVFSLSAEFRLVPNYKIIIFGRLSIITCTKSLLEGDRLPKPLLDPPPALEYHGRIPPPEARLMPHQLIADLKEGDAVQQYFMVPQAETRLDKSGNPYLSLALGDKSGAMVARVWNKVLAKCPGPFAPGDHVGVQAQVESYKGELQLNIRYINTVAALRDLGRDLQEYDPELLCQATPYDRQTLWQELWQVAETQIGPPLGELVLKILDHNREELLVCNT